MFPTIRYAITWQSRNSFISPHLELWGFFLRMKERAGPLLLLSSKSLSLRRNLCKDENNMVQRRMRNWSGGVARLRIRPLPSAALDILSACCWYNILSAAEGRGLVLETRRWTEVSAQTKTTRFKGGWETRGEGEWLQFVTNLLSFCLCYERMFSLAVSAARGGMQSIIIRYALG